MTEITEGNLSGPIIEVRETPEAAETVVLRGQWTLQGLTHRSSSIRTRLKDLASNPRLCWDLREIDSLDRVGALILWQAWGEHRPQRLHLHPKQQSLFAYWEGTEPLPPSPRWRPPNLLQALLKRISTLFDHARDLTILIGQLVLDIGYLLRHPVQIPWREISATIHMAGGRALPITALVGLLIGVVISYLSILQLQRYGAESYIISILGLFIIREIGPMLAAILVAGRSGSAITAEIGVMRVTQELDALTALGISHTIRLVLPRVIALILVLPLLIVWTDAIALLGGILSAQFTLHIGYGQFLIDLPAAVPIANFWIGLLKGVSFGILVALVACHFGLRIQPNTQSLAAETTNSVVTAITLIILADAGFAILFREVGLP